jgi:hypothetical protein
MLTATAVFNEPPPTESGEWHPVFLSMGKASTPARSVTNDSANATHRRKSLEGLRLGKPIVSTWPAQKLRPGLCRSNRPFFESGCQVSKPGNPHFSLEFVCHAAAFTTANA